MPLPSETSSSQSGRGYTLATVLGRAMARAQWWTEERAWDLGRWRRRLRNELPERSRRLKQTLAAARSATAASGVASQGTGQTAGLLAGMLATRLFDLAGGPELAELALHMLTHSTPLTDGEQAAATAVLGAQAVRWNEVRVAQGGLLVPIFLGNGGRAFTAWHTICLPGTGLRVRANLSLMVHEAVHVYQYELLGTAYMIEALHAQHTVEGYDYGSAPGLRQGRAEGRRYSSYNREQQAQIAQDYYLLTFQATQDETEQQQIAESCACYEPYIQELRAGEL